MSILHFVNLFFKRLYKNEKNTIFFGFGLYLIGCFAGSFVSFFEPFSSLFQLYFISTILIILGVFFIKNKIKDWLKLYL